MKMLTELDYLEIQKRMRRRALVLDVTVGVAMIVCSIALLAMTYSAMNVGG